ncbi:glutamate receptor 2-like isoform X2 [Amphiura filiformis]|uniref:glutamate receptor 2-like isoform X2 n=1 Tax=Amphiura filiformis TaxID=82378 RepID=UPI003B2167FD
MMLMSVHRCGIITVFCTPVFLMLCYLCHCALSGSGTTIVNIGFMSNERRAPVILFRQAIVYHNTRRNSSYQFFCYDRRAMVGDSFNATRTLCHNYASKAVLGGGPVELTSVDAIRSHSNHYKVPYITASISKRDIGLERRPRGNDFLISVRPPLVPLVVTLVQYFKWKSFGYIYDNNIGLARLNRLLQELPTMKYDIAFRMITDDDENIRDTLKQFRDTQRHRIIVDTSLNNTKRLLQAATLLGAITSSYHYIILNLDVEEINFYQYQFGGMNITGFSIINRTHPVFENQYRDWVNVTRYKRPPLPDEIMGSEAALSFDIAKVMEQAISDVMIDRYAIGAGEYFRSHGPFWSYKDCADDDFKPWSSIDELILTAVKGVILPRDNEFVEGMTGRIQFDDFGERINYTIRLLSLYSNGLQPIAEYTHISPDIPPDNEDPATPGTPADMYPTSALRFYNDQSPTNSQLDLRNRTIIVTSVADSPYLILKDNHLMLDGNDKFDGYCIDLLKQINTIFPFSYNITLSNAYGAYNNKTKKWSGMVAELINGTADIAVASLTISAEREKVIDFTKPFMSLGISIMVKKPQNIKPEVFSFMRPLSPDIWLCIVFAYIGVSVVLFLVSRFSPDEWYTVETMQNSGNNDARVSNNSMSDERTNDFDFPNSLWFSMGALMQQGCDICPRALSGRIVGGVWWFFTLIVISSYTANLAAFLTVTRMDSPINSAEDLVQQKDISYGCLGSGSTKDFFENSDIPVYAKMWQTMKNADPPPFAETNAQGVEMVRNGDGKYVFLTESTTNEYISQQQPCDTMKVGSNLDSKGYGIGVSRNLPDFGDNLTLAILELREKGILAGLEKKWWYDKGQCDDAPGAKDKAPLSLSNVAGVFYILVSGLAVAMVIAVLEFYWKSRALSRKQKVSLTTAMRDKVRLSVTGDATPLPPELAPILKKASNVYSNDQTPTASEEKIVLNNQVGEKRLTPPGDTEV